MGRSLRRGDRKKRPPIRARGIVRGTGAPHARDNLRTGVHGVAHERAIDAVEREGTGLVGITVHSDHKAEVGTVKPRNRRGRERP